MRSLIPMALGSLTMGCLDPLVSDMPTASLHVLPAGTEVAHVSSNPDLARQIRVNDGLNDNQLAMNGGAVRLRTGWAGGAEIQYWDLGDTSETASLLYVLVARDGETLTPVAHPYIAEALPGDVGYSALLLVQHVVVTPRYQGHVIPSREAIADAIDLGLIEEPVPAPLFIDGPIVPAGTTLATAGAPIATAPVYVHGYRADLLPVGGAAAFRPLARAGRLPRGDVHRIWVGNAVAAVAEPTFQNGAMPWTPMVRVIECQVTPAVDGTPVTSEAELFTRDTMGNLTAATDRVMDWELTPSIKNWPVHVPEVSP